MGATTITSGVTSSGLTLSAADSLTVLSGGIADASVVSTGAVVLVEPGGIVSGTGVAGGGLTLLGGVEYATTVGGPDNLLGYDDVIAGGVASGTTVNAGGEENISGGNGFDTNINSGGAQFVWFGGVTSATINHGGYQFVGAGGAAVSTTVNAGGSQKISGGTAYGTSVGAFGQEQVGGGGEVTASIIDSGGTEYVDSGGTASRSLLQDGALQLVDGGTALDTIVEGGGTQIISGPGGTASAGNTVIEAGGREILFSGAVETGATIAGGALELLSGAIASGAISFTGGGALIIDSAAMPAAVISGFGSGGSIYLPEVTYTGTETVAVSAPGTVTLSEGPDTYTLQIAGAVADTGFTVGALHGGVVLSEIPCFAAGTRILTPRGEIAVEALRPGDSVISSDGEDMDVVWAGHRRIDLRRHPRPHLVQPIRIPAGALADGVPARDLTLSPDHALLLYGHLVPVKALAGAGGIRQLCRDTVQYHHLELARHAVIFAENTAVESYLDTGNRGCFENFTGAISLHPNFAQALREAKSCAPFADAGPVVEMARWEIAHRAGAVQESTTFCEQKLAKELGLA